MKKKCQKDKEKKEGDKNGRNKEPEYGLAMHVRMLFSTVVLTDLFGFFAPSSVFVFRLCVFFFSWQEVLRNETW
jgi:hypothetical protein